MKARTFLLVVGLVLVMAGTLIIGLGYAKPSLIPSLLANTNIRLGALGNVTVTTVASTVTTTPVVTVTSTSQQGTSTLTTTYATTIAPASTIVTVTNGSLRTTISTKLVNVTSTSGPVFLSSSISQILAGGFALGIGVIMIMVITRSGAVKL